MKTARTQPRAVRTIQRFSVKNPKNELDKRFLRVLAKVRAEDNIRMSVFDHPLAIEQVLTLRIIEEQISNRKYTNQHWKFIEDVNIAFDFIIQNYSKQTKRHMAAIKLRAIFHREMDILMESEGFCCGRFYWRQAQIVYCCGKSRCIVAEDTLYYRHKHFSFCKVCFDNINGDFFQLKNEEIRVHKNDFVEFKYDKPKSEAFVQCQTCRREFHETCVLHSRASDDPFYCKKCSKLPQSLPRASKLASTECDRHINEFLKNQGVNQNDTITIRVLSDSLDMIYSMKKLKEFIKGDTNFSCRNCCLFAFFDTGSGNDICFFAVYFQIYGTDAPPSLQMTAYINYLDSVNLLPSLNRTKIYQSILVGLLSYFKTQSVEKVLLWSCPAQQNQDYVLCAKPSLMKMPTQEMLNAWYLKIMRLGSRLEVIKSFQGIGEYAVQKNWNDIECVPLIEDDLLCVKLKELLNSVKREKSKLARETEKLDRNLHKKKKNMTKAKTEALRAKLDVHIKAIEDFDMKEKLKSMLFKEMEYYNGQYFMIHLTTGTSIKRETSPAHPLSESHKWLSDRHVFWDFFSTSLLEFSSEKRAKFSTFVMLRRIFVENQICIECAKKSPRELSCAALCQMCHQNRSSLMSMKEPDLKMARFMNFVILDEPCEAKVAVSVKRKTRVVKSEFANSKSTSIQQAALDAKPSTIALDKSMLDSSMPLPGYSNSTLKDVEMKTAENSMESSDSGYLSSSPQEFDFVDVSMIKNDRDDPIDDEDVKQFIIEPIDLIEDNDDCVFVSIKAWTKMTIPRNVFPEGDIICLDSDD